ncbi:poly(A) RNA polymerase, mitochondrial-like isoform X2 [Oratosquilla oratoria]|uniref:poly(A) RNA polymerase, mitochondrial-like isoform X1 n=1 Tax=Oratosquilla oratoria TaxID=337810 RepID=UPI003F762C77
MNMATPMFRVNRAGSLWTLFRPRLVGDVNDTVNQSLRARIRCSSNYTNDEPFVAFDHLLARRRKEAQSSLLVEVATLASATDLHNVCSQFGEINKMFHYSLPIGNGRKSKELILVEYADANSVVSCLQNVKHNTQSTVIPVHSPFLWLASEQSGNKKKNQPLLETKLPTIMVQHHSPITKSELDVRLGEMPHMSSQMFELYSHQKLTELGARLRFFTCRQIELALSSLFPDATILPFGSSVNTYGRTNCDLDMILQLADRENKVGGSRLVFQAKQSYSHSNPRITMQRHMEVIADIIDNFAPGCSQVRKIMGARVPIIKYRQNLTGVECDLSMANKSGLYMSELLYIYGSMDPRVRPLVFTVRHWARERHLTSLSAGRWVTNFSLTLLVLFFLIHSKILPPLNKLISIAGDKDRRQTDGIDCTFLRDITKLEASSNSSDLGTLLKEFFEFYDNFDFKERGISIITGNHFTKPEHSALYIQNPLERELNVSRNVTLEEMERLRLEVTHARYLLESKICPTDVIPGEPWGLLQLWQDPRKIIPKPQVAHSINWKEVFHIKEKEPEPKTSTSVGKKRPILEASELNGLVTKLKQTVINKKEKRYTRRQRGKTTVQYKW